MECSDKMELFCDIKYWEEAISKGINKGIDKELLSLLSDPRGRASLINAIENGDYKISPPKVSQIPKANGKVREIYINDKMDRIVLSIINRVYYDIYKDKIHTSCVSYQKGIGVPKIVRNLSQRLTCGEKGYKIDLSKYFDSVNKETLIKTLEELNTDSPLDDILYDYYTDDRVYIDGEIVERYKSIAQGCAFGTLLANIILYDIDEYISAMDVLYLRYSDDILILGNDADKAMDALQVMLKPKGLSINPDKVDFIDKNKEFTFLGAKIKGKEIDMSDESILKYKKKIKEITKMRKGMKTKDRNTQKIAIKRINKYLYEDNMKNSKEFGWGRYFFNLVNTDETLKKLDEFTKDHIKHMYTGKWNHTTNMHKTSNEQLMDMGYKSLVHMYSCYNLDSNLYESEIIKKKVSA